MSRHPLEAYAESYEMMGRIGSGTVHPECVAIDIRQNMIPATQAIAPPLAAGSVDTVPMPVFVACRDARDFWQKRAEKAELLLASVSALAHKWNKYAVNDGFAASEAGLDLLELMGWPKA